ncbi:CRTAC1 family protein [Candidatus Poribacteria bacterium]|nr:CRTAC1 family protein [Candidatus Poribacteria bacterium]MYK93404.1 CRTAC1 family protein [Candidatus Poribacteria bacterium]
MGSGVALFDFDNDGDLDLYLVNGSDLPGATASIPPTNRLYRNDGDTFTDVTTQAAVGDTGYGLGCCVGDYNNDGFTDLYVTNYGANVLYHNNGDGTFTDVTGSAGVEGDRFSSGCAFVDLDADGYLDLYVVNYVQFDLETNPECNRQGVRTYCTPEALQGATDILYRNNGDGTFTDVTAKAGIGGADGKGLGIVCGDIDNDGDVDIFVANDTTPNFLYRNDSDTAIRMTEDALFAGVALSEEGRAYSGMGANLGDFDNDGYLDIVITNFQDQTNSLYHNAQSGFFNEMSFAKGIGERSLPYLAWGVDLIDFNNDGWLDLFVANGHLDDNVAEIDPIGTYAQPNQLFLSNGGINFVEAVDAAIADQKVSRGTAFGDIDNDGDVDIVVSNLKDTPTLLRNDSDKTSRWLSVKLVGTHCNRDAIGARVTVVSGNLTQIREVKSGSGYLSQNDLRLHFGLGDATRVDRLTVRWLCGKVQTLQNIETNQVLVISEK